MNTEAGISSPMGRTCALAFLTMFVAPFLAYSDALGQQPSNQVPKIEQYVVAQLQAGETADLKDRFPIKEDRRLSARILVNLLMGNLPNLKADGRAIRIRGALFDEPIVLNGETVSYDTQLLECEFRRGIDFRGVHFLKSLNLTGSKFIGRVRGADFNEIKIDDSVYFGSTIFSWVADFSGMKVGGSADFYEAVFDDLASFANVKVGGNADFRGATFKYVAGFMGAEIGGDFLAQTARFLAEPADTLLFDRMSVKRNCEFNFAIFNSFPSFADAEIGQDFWLAGTKFTQKPDSKSEINFNGLQIKGQAILRPTAIKGTWSFQDAHVGRLILESVQHDPLTMENLLLSRTAVEHNLRLRNIQVNQLSGPSMRVLGETTLDHVEIQDQIDLHNAQFTTLKLIDTKKPENRANVSLDVMVGDGLNTGWENDGARELEGWLRESKYSRNSYSRLDAFLRSHGYIDRAAEVFIDMKRRERNENSNVWSTDWWSNFLQDKLVRFGRSPELALLYSFITVVVGMIVFRRRQYMEPQKVEDSSLAYSSFWYSLDLLTPFIDLQAANVWRPRQDWRTGRTYARVHRILGWTLIPIGLAAVTGLIK